MILTTVNLFIFLSSLTPLTVTLYFALHKQGNICTVRSCRSPPSAQPGTRWTTHKCLLAPSSPTCCIPRGTTHPPPALPPCSPQVPGGPPTQLDRAGSPASKEGEGRGGAEVGERLPRRAEAWPLPPLGGRAPPRPVPRSHAAPGGRFRSGDPALRTEPQPPALGRRPDPSQPWPVEAPPRPGDDSPSPQCPAAGAALPSPKPGRGGRMPGLPWAQVGRRLGEAAGSPRGPALPPTSKKTRGPRGPGRTTQDRPSAPPARVPPLPPSPPQGADDP